MSTRLALFDPFSGIAGDMTVGALIDAGANEAEIRSGLQSLPIDGYKIRVERVLRSHLSGTQFIVELPDGPEHAHRGLGDVKRILDEADVPPRALARAHSIFVALAEAEAHIHGTTTDEVHFHEVGAVDAIVDIMGTCLGLESLGIDEIATRPIEVGGGTVKAAHGQLPVPAPATALLLRGLPVAHGRADGELTTPTGAAILAALATRAVPVGPFRWEAIGHGAGTRDPEGRPNLLRVFVGRAETADLDSELWQVEFHVDDQSPEHLAPLPDRLIRAGARDAWVTPIIGKKGRSALLVAALVDEPHREQVEERIFQETTSFGVRRHRVERTILERDHVVVETEWGPVRVKVGRRRGEVLTASPEYEDCLRIAEDRDVSLRRVFEAARAAYLSA